MVRSERLRLYAVLFAQRLISVTFRVDTFEEAEEARAQMKHSPHSKVLVLNCDPPAGSLTLDLVDDAVTTMRDVFEGEIDAYLLFYRR